MSELQLAVLQARLDALREAKKAVEGTPDALAALENLVVQAEEAVGTGLFPIGTTVGYADLYGTVVEHTDSSHVNGEGYILDGGTWISARSMFLFPLDLDKDLY